MIISISSVTAKSQLWVYVATKAGLSHFLTSLFEEVRKSGVKITTIHPDITKSNFYDSLILLMQTKKTQRITDEQLPMHLNTCFQTAVTLL